MTHGNNAFQLLHAEKRAFGRALIGIGAGNNTDGQVLVWSDMLGFFEDFKPKFVRHYLNASKLVKEAVKQYTTDVQNNSFPSKEEEY